MVHVVGMDVADLGLVADVVHHVADLVYESPDLDKDCGAKKAELDFVMEVPSDSEPVEGALDCFAVRGTPSFTGACA